MAYIGNDPFLSSQRQVTDFTATAGQDTFTPAGGYQLGYVDVYQNGILLVDGTDYTASNGTSVVLTEAATVGDSIKLVTYVPRGLTDGYTKLEADARYMDINEETLPSQTGQSGNYLTTDGTTASWGQITDPTPAAVSDQDNTSTGYFDIPSGTTAQRPSSPNTGYLRFNSDLSIAEYWDGTAWKGIDTPPIITTVSPTTVLAATSNVTINGTNFVSGATVSFVGADNTVYNSPSVTFNSANQVVASVPSPALTVANEPYTVKLTNPSGLRAVAEGVIDAGSEPTWNYSNNATLATVFENTSVNISALANEPDGEALSASITSGSLHSGLTLNANTTITGTAGAVSGTTTNTFSVEASDGTNSTSRTFSIIIRNVDTVTNESVSNWSVSGSTSGQRSPESGRYFTGGTSKQVIVSSDHYSNSRAKCWLTSNNQSTGTGGFWRGSGTSASADTMEIWFGTDEVCLTNLLVFSYPDSQYIMRDIGLQRWNGSSYVTLVGINHHSTSTSGWSLSQSNSPSTNTTRFQFTGSITDADAYKSTNWRLVYGPNVNSGSDDLVHQSGCGNLSYYNFG